MVNIRENLTLKACRTIANIRADKIAAAAGVTVDTYYKWEKGKSYPTAPQMIRIIQCFANNGYSVNINDIKFF